MLANSTKGLGHENVNGLNLVPYPPTKINAFIIFNIYSVYIILYIYKLRFLFYESNFSNWVVASIIFDNCNVYNFNIQSPDEQETLQQGGVYHFRLNDNEVKINDREEFMKFVMLHQDKALKKDNSFL